MIDYVGTVTTIQLDERVVTVETRTVELVRIETQGIQGAVGPQGEKGDGVNFFTVDMDGLSSDLFVNHNLGRPVAVAKLYTPDGKISDLYVENLDQTGQGSTITAWVASSIPMLGKLTLI